ncbi:hypothetical protein [Paraburkholderia tuberum]|nr:hypothetical protein [Paraburkholderia tuberum]
MNDTIIPLHALVERYVWLEGAISSRPLTIVFFRHGKGSWDVFPPVEQAPAMSARYF